MAHSGVITLILKLFLASNPEYVEVENETMPIWVGRMPNPKVVGAGLPQLPGTRHVTIYNSTSPQGGKNPHGLYNHGPMLIYLSEKLDINVSMQNRFLACWYNGPEREGHLNRVVLSLSSPDAQLWSEPVTIFPSVDAKGEENEPFAIIDGRLYGTASDLTFDNAHDSGVRGGLLMRRIRSMTDMGPIFWLASSVPSCGTQQNCSFDKYPLYTDLADAQTKSDAAEYLRSLVNETVRHGGVNGTNKFNERSLYALPGQENSLVLLLRDGGKINAQKQYSHKHLWASRCTLPSSLSPFLPANPQRGTMSCRSGTGAYDYELPSRRRLTHSATHTRQCNWSTPIQTNIPDAASRTCAARLPVGQGVGVVGNQGGGGRDPLTFITSRDGLHFDMHWSVVSGAPSPKWFGFPGFQYPSFVWCTGGCVGTDGRGVKDQILFTFSVNKEDIMVVSAPLSSIMDI